MKIKKFIVYIKFTHRNTFISVIQKELNNYKLSYKPLVVYSCGSLGFKGRQKETYFAVIKLIYKIIVFINTFKINKVHVIFNGVSFYRKIILTTLLQNNLKNKKFKIKSITDKTQIPFNGCRLQKYKHR